MAKSRQAEFTHLHVHSEYSMLDGMIRFKELMPQLQQLGMKSIAITDHGVMHGAQQFYKEAHNAEIKPIMGVEAYIAPNHLEKGGGIRNDAGEKAYNHLTLLAKNRTGYLNLVKLVSIANTAGYYYKPRIDFELLKQYHEGLVVLSGCYGGELAQVFFKHHEDEKKALKEGAKLVEKYKSLFGDDYYLEIQRGTADQASQEKVDHLYRKLATNMKMPLVATTDAHYLYKSDADIQNILWAITEGRTIYDPKHRPMVSKELYIKSPEEMVEVFKDIPDSVYRTMEINEKIEEYPIGFDRIQPSFPDVPKGKSVKGYLRERVFEGLQSKFGEKLPKEVVERAEYELEVIDGKGYNDYFLIVSDMVAWTKSQGYLIKVRGSAASSIVAYSLDITTLDPLRWRLPFERFLNPERPSPPDIDLDIQDDIRDQVINYVVHKYGREQVSGISAIGRLKTKAAIRDVSRALGIDLQTADRIAKQIPVKYGKPMPIKEALEKIPELAEIINGDQRMPQLVEAVDRLSGSARHLSVHACGHLITPEPIINYTALVKAPKKDDEFITQMEFMALEDIGLMKFDFLGLKNLTIIRNALLYIKDAYGVDVDVNALPEDDAKSFQLLQLAMTDSVFQLESSGMKKYLKELHPEKIDDIIFMVAAYRPGPMEYIPKYIECKNGQREVEFLHPDLEPILGYTYGVAIYQEQILEMAVKMAGYTMGKADVLRKALGKKIKEILDEQKEVFVNGCVGQGYTRDLGEKLFEYALPFANYGFNKAHAAVYAFTSYQTAYLKSHYPLEFVAGVLKTHLHDSAETLQDDIRMAMEMYITILPPDVNESNIDFVITERNKEAAEGWLDAFAQKQTKDLNLGSIRFGLGGIKSVSEKAIVEIVRERENGPYVNLDDLLTRVDLSQVDKKTLLNLAMVGAFDQWGERAAFIQLIPELYEKYKASKKAVHAAQKSLFGALPESAQPLHPAATPLPAVEEVSTSQKVQWEQQLLGVLLSEPPLAKLASYFAQKKILGLEEVLQQRPAKPVKIGVQYNKHRVIQTKNGENMAFVDLSDLSGKIDGVIFPADFQKLGSKVDPLTPSAIVVATGRYQQRDADRHSFIINEIEMIPGEQIDQIVHHEAPEPVEVKTESTLEEAHPASVEDAQPESVSLFLKPDIGREELAELRAALEQSKGTTILYMAMTGANNQVVKKKYKQPVDLNAQLQQILQRVGRISFD